jgi:choline dehydrogenase
LGIGCVWEYQRPLPPLNNASEATVFWKSDPALDTPDVQLMQAESMFCSAEIAAKFNPPGDSWTLFGGVVRTKSRGHVRLTGPNPHDPIEIDACEHLVAGGKVAYSRPKLSITYLPK